ncbi:MAG: hypothetical protein HY835_10235, partial [Anaerolineae bacterium]|nr:hypothetical protein [Anaerolineae bacterium]
DNAQTDRLALETLAAKERFLALSGLTADRLIVFGHSLGARVALQAAGMDAQPPLGLVLFGAQVNLGTNTQAEFFTGTSDAGLAWVQALGPQTPASQILLVSGTWDDILTPQAAQALICKLDGGVCVSGAGREWLLLPNLLHNYEVYSPRALDKAVHWTADVLALPAPIPNGAAAARVWIWPVSFALLLAGVYCAGRWAELVVTLPAPAAPGGVVITAPRRFIVAKLVWWLGALPLAALVGGVFVFLPLSKPVLNLYYVGFIGAYGGLMLLLYRLGRMGGTRGRLPFAPETLAGRKPGLALLLSLGVFGLTALFAHSGWTFVYPLNLRLVWLALFTPVTALGFWIGLKETAMLREGLRQSASRYERLNGVIGLVPFFLYALLMGVLGSLSGLTGSLQGLLILWLAILFGQAVYRLSGRAWLTALLQAALLYWLLLPAGVLFS